MITRSVAAGLLASIFIGGAVAQTAGTVNGSVQDPGGAYIPNAGIEMYLAGGTKPAITSKTASDGFFTISGVRPEIYQIKVTATGFAPFVLNGVVVDPARETSVPPIKLQVGTVSSSVEVKTETEGVQTSNVEITTTVSMEQVANLPVVNRSPLTLIGTQAGVLTTGPDNSTINGQRSSFTNITMDGVNIQDNFIRTNDLDFLPNLLLSGQVSEFSVSTSNMDASQTAASAVTFITPSGTNAFHGTAFWSNRNNYFAANTWFNNQAGIKRPFLNQNQLGGTLAGHIIKDRWFYYGNYEAFRLRQQTAVSTTILTADARNGIFTYKDTSGNIQKANVLALAGASINSAIAPIIAQVPTPDKINNFNSGDSTAAFSRNTAGYSFLGRNNRTRDNVTVKSDYNVSSRQQVSASYIWNRDILDRPDAATDFSLVPKVFNNDVTKFVSGSWRFTPTATITNELRGGFNLSPSIFATNQQFGSSILTGFIFTNPENTFRAQGRNTNTYNLNDNATWVKGKHYVKFGFAYQSIRTAPYNDAGITPVYTIGLGTGHTGLVSGQFPTGISANDLSTANSLLQSLEGAVTSSSQTFNVTSQNSGFVNGATLLRHFVYDNYAGYIQDNWRVRPNFTIEAGLRYEYYVPLRETNNLELVAQIQNNNVASTLLDPNGAFNFVGSGGFYRPDKKDFGPRIGFAWNVFGNNKTSVRGGYGIYFVNDSVITAVRNSVETNPGLSSSSGQTGLTTFASNVAAVPIPTFMVPRTSVDNYNLNPSANAIGITNPNLKVPYVGQYSISIQHEFKDTVISVGYIGNHGTRLLRGTDYNQVIINNGLLADFKRAANNGFLAQTATGKFTPTYNAAIAGSQPLTFFPSQPNGGYLTNSTVLSYLQTGQVGQLASFYQTNQVNGVNYFPNPNALGANYTSNGADSTYNSLQIDAHRRYQNGLLIQANYTYSKVLSNALGDTQTNFEPFLDNANPQAERAPAPFDLRHIFKANGVYALPAGPGHSFNPKYLGRVVGGWSIGSILTWQSGAPFSIYEGARGTLNRGSRSTYNTVVPLASGDALFNSAALNITGNGPYFFPPSAIGSDGRGTAPDGSAPFAGQLFANPAAGTIGSLQRRVFNGPNEFNQDLSVLKDLKIYERHTLQFRMDATNVYNHASFAVGDQNINSTTFGKITANFFSRRLIQFQLTYKF